MAQTVGTPVMRRADAWWMAIKGAGEESMVHHAPESSPVRHHNDASWVIRTPPSPAASASPRLFRSAPQLFDLRDELGLARRL